MKHSKRYRAAAEKVEAEKLYGLREAVELYKQIATAKFNESLEVHGRLGVDPRHADQMVRSSVILPHGTGKSTRVLVFAKGEKLCNRTHPPHAANIFQEYHNSDNKLYLY